MSILSKKKELWKRIESHIPHKVHTLFTFGFETLVGQELVSTRANARLTKYPWSTAKSKMWRLCTNTRILTVFPQLLATLACIANDDIIAIDFSDFKDGRQVLMFAKQTHDGRALPVYFEILEYPIQKDSQNLFVVTAIRNFFMLVGCTPTLVFDRGFACPSIIHFLAQNQYQFIIRIKKRKRICVRDTGAVVASEDLPHTDCGVSAYGHLLRIVVSDDPQNGNDPWYLITNNMHTSREIIIDQYYHRFEIEEFFRDAKRLIGLEYIHMKTTHGLAIMLWFTVLTMWCFSLIAETLTETDEALRTTWRLSKFRYVLELLRKEMYQSAVDAMEQKLRTSGAG